MKLKAVSGIMLTLLLLGMLILRFNIQPVKAELGTIYIRADGSVEPSTANITSSDNVTYYFTDNIYDEIVVERDNIVVDGAGYRLQGTGVYDSKGIDLTGRNNITNKNMEIDAFWWGIWLEDSSSNNIIGNTITNHEGYGIYSIQGSSNNGIFGNSITNNDDGVYFHSSNHNNIVGNNITGNNDDGIRIDVFSNYNIVAGNIITNNGLHGLDLNGDLNSIVGNNIIGNKYDGIRLDVSSEYNRISGNNITNNYDGIYLEKASNNSIYHNNFINNTEQVYLAHLNDINIWDDSYPSGGNYWSDYTGVDNCGGPYQNETGSDGIGDTPYFIDENNRDNYPLMNPWTPKNAIRKLIRDVENMNLQQGIDNSLDAKLTVALGALEALNADQRNDAINKLDAFVNEIEAQREKKLTNEQADYLIGAAQEIINLLG